MTDIAALAILASIAANLATAIYAVGLLRRLRESEYRRLDADRERQETETWADKWESEAVQSAQQLGDLRRQYASLQAMYALRTRELLKNSQEIVMVNVAWKRTGK
jgi:Fic family protein